MKALAILLVVAGAVAGTARADSIDAIVRARVQPHTPQHLGVARVHVPPQLEKFDGDPAKVAVELPRELRAGRASLKVTVAGQRSVWVPVSFAGLSDVYVAQRAIAAGQAITAADVALEQRALDGTAPAPGNVVGGIAAKALAPGEAIGARDVTLPLPLARGTQVSVEIQRGTVRVRGTAILEFAARPGESATARLAQTHTLVKGTLVAPSTLVVGGNP
ncbi:MAG: flagella basal body P-ring formation protein FlgA [Deltaproteobacteria bacterium]|nr:flagella basal body P-ring formation protein FlgA [Deltaproteobacteria bacterium]MCW5804103.1 flagella basal body P-ring formation protein FlgA [Deltaproteobacteria bacterium]